MQTCRHHAAAAGRPAAINSTHLKEFPGLPKSYHESEPYKMILFYFVITDATIQHLTAARAYEIGLWNFATKLPVGICSNDRSVHSSCAIRDCCCMHGDRTVRSIINISS
jgi:hypothetical protein